MAIETLSEPTHTKFATSVINIVWPIRMSSLFSLFHDLHVETNRPVAPRSHICQLSSDSPQKDDLALLTEHLGMPVTVGKADCLTITGCMNTWRSPTDLHTSNKIYAGVRGLREIHHDHCCKPVTLSPCSLQYTT